METPDKTTGSQQGKFELRPYSQKEIRAIYGISFSTFKKWIEPFEKELGELKGKQYTVNQVRLIVEKIGIPTVIDIE